MIRPIAPITYALISVAALLLFIGNSAALAASSCKGLAKSKCESSSSCSWVSGYTTEKGKKTAAYCRTKSGTGKSSKSSEKSGKKADKSKQSDKDKKTSKSSNESKKSSKADKDKKSKSKESKDSTKK